MTCDSHHCVPSFLPHGQLLHGHALLVNPVGRVGRLACTLLDLEIPPNIPRSTLRACMGRRHLYNVARPGIEPATSEYMIGLLTTYTTNVGSVDGQRTGHNMTRLRV